MIRDLRIMTFMLAFLCGGLACGWIYHEHVVTGLTARIDQLEEDSGDACVAYPTEAEDT